MSADLLSEVHDLQPRVLVGAGGRDLEKVGVGAGGARGHADIDGGVEVDVQVLGFLPGRRSNR